MNISITNFVIENNEIVNRTVYDVYDTNMIDLNNIITE